MAVEAIAFEALGFDGGARGGLAVNGTTEDVASGFGGGGDTELAFSFDLVGCKHGGMVAWG